jgi:hypothetical protein
VNILSEVEYPLRKPDWFSLKTEKDSENSVNLSFSIAVKSLSDYFTCDNGIRQGENLSPFLFSLFLNDLETFLEAKNVTGLESISSDLENQLNIYLKLFIILYADDTVTLSESESYLQAQLDAFHEYCLT